MFAAAADHDEVGDIAAIERDALELCARRQEIITDIVEGEKALVAFVVRSTPEPPLEPVGAIAGLPAKAGTEEVVEPAVESPAGADEEAMIVVPVPEPPELRWTVVYGAAGEWIAGISDGTRVWYVRPGDELPSGVRVLSVRVRPPGVKVRGDEEDWFLPGPGEALGPQG